MILTAHQYRDRAEAGQVLGRQLAHYASRVDTLVLAISEDAVSVATEVASYLNAPLDAFIVQPITSSDDGNATLGAIAPGGVSVFDDCTIEEAGVSPQDIAAMTSRSMAELERRQQYYRGRRPMPQFAGRVIILVNDGLASGLLMHAAVIALHRQQPAWLVAAAPVGSVDACADLAQEVHELVCPLRPEPLQSVGLWYDHFAPSNDDDVRAALRRSSGLPRA
jgi:predicted phosphoribosyltransferase